MRCHTSSSTDFKINEGVNRYTGEEISDGNPFPEVNRLNIEAWERLLVRSSLGSNPL